MKTALFVMPMILTAACAASGDPPEPTAVGATASVASELTNACTVQCNNAWLQCNATCERFPRPSCEASCDQRLATCDASCGCPSTREFDRVVFDHAIQRPGSTCVGDVQTSTGLQYGHYDKFTRTEHVRETLQCDGSKTQTVLSFVVNGPVPCLHKEVDIPCTAVEVAPSAGLCIF